MGLGSLNPFKPGSVYEQAAQTASNFYGSIYDPLAGWSA